MHHRRSEEKRLIVLVQALVVVLKLLVDHLLAPLLQPVQFPRRLLVRFILLHEPVLVLLHLDRAWQILERTGHDVVFFHVQVLVQSKLALLLILVLLPWFFHVRYDYRALFNFVQALFLEAKLLPRVLHRIRLRSFEIVADRSFIFHEARRPSSRFILPDGSWSVICFFV